MIDAVRDSSVRDLSAIHRWNAGPPRGGVDNRKHRTRTAERASRESRKSRDALHEGAIFAPFGQSQVPGTHAGSAHGSKGGGRKYSGEGSSAVDRLFGDSGHTGDDNKRNNNTRRWREGPLYVGRRACMCERMCM